MDEFIAYRLPYNLEAEQSVLGAVLVDSTCMTRALEILQPECFYQHENAAIFGIMVQLFTSAKTVDFITVLEAVQQEGVFDNPDDAKIYLAQLIQIVPSTANLEAYANIVREKHDLRRLIAAAQEVVELANGGTVEDVQGALQNALDSTGDSKSVTAVSLTDASVELWNDLQRRCVEGKSISGLKTGYDDLDRLLGGLRSGNMIVLAARSGMGKSAFALNIATEAAKLNKSNILVFSLEMGSIELCERILARYADLDLNKIRDAQLSSDEWCRMADTASRVTKYAVRIVEAPVLDIEEISRICRREKPSLVIIDHIGLIRPSGKYRDRREAVDGISRSIKQLAKDLGVPIIAVAQLNRAVMGRSNKRPLLSDLRESGAIEQDADSVLLIHRPSYFDEDSDKTEANLIVAKNRNGKTGTIPLRWFGSRQHFLAEWRKGADAECLQEELPC